MWNHVHREVEKLETQFPRSCISCYRGRVPHAASTFSWHRSGPLQLCDFLPLREETVQVREDEHEGHNRNGPKESFSASVRTLQARRAGNRSRPLPKLHQRRAASARAGGGAEVAILPLQRLAPGPLFLQRAVEALPAGGRPTPSAPGAPGTAPKAAVLGQFSGGFIWGS